LTFSDTFAHFACAIRQLGDSSAIPIFSHEIDELDKMHKKYRDEENTDSIEVGTLLRIPSDFESKKIINKTVIIRQNLSDEKVKKIIEKYDLKDVYMILKDESQLKRYIPILQKCTSLGFDIINESKTAIELHVPNLESFETVGTTIPKISGTNRLIKYKISEESQNSNFLQKIPETIKCLHIFELPEICRPNLFVELSKKLPNLINLNIEYGLLQTKNKSKIRELKNLTSLSFGIDHENSANFYTKKNIGWLRDNKNLKKIIIHFGKDISITMQNKINFRNNCPFPKFLEVLKIRGNAVFNKLGEIKNAKIIRFLPFKNLKELSLPISGTLSTNLQNNSINLIPSVGILELILNSIMSINIEDPIQIPESVYYLKIISINSYLGGFNRIQIPKNSAIAQIDITFHSIEIEYIVSFLSKINKKIDVKIDAVLFKRQSAEYTNMIEQLKINNNLHILEYV